MKKTTQTLLLILILIGCLLTSLPTHTTAKLPPPGVSVIPTDGAQHLNQTPTLFINYTKSRLDRDTFQLYIDGEEIPQQDINITQNNATYIPKEKLSGGAHKILIRYDFPYDDSVPVTYTWTISVDEPFDFQQLTTTILLVTGIVFIALIIYILYLKKTKNFTFQKFFIQHPIKNEVITIYIPLILSFLSGLLLVMYVQSQPEESVNPYIYEYIFILVSAVAIAPYGISAQLARKKLGQYERAFSQFLFEISDAMRGGLDPTKAVIEVGRHDNSILKKHLAKAADNIKLGRPFEDVMNALAKPIKSELIKRYALMIGETSKVGGEPATVVHRAAKDMDDFIKINDERRRQLGNQITIIYIGFIVLLVVIYLLIYLYPALSEIDISFLGGGGMAAATQDLENTRMSFLTVKQRFFDLLLVNSLFTGTIIGSFVDGNIKYGFIHSLIMIAVTVIFFLLMVM